MSLLVVLLIVWSVVTSALILVWIYRGVVGMREDDQLFLDSAQSQMAEEQREVMERLNRTAPYMKFLGVASGVLLAVILGVWLYQGLTTVR